MPPTLTLPPTKTWPKQGEWTYEDYLALPDDGRRYEIIEGVLYMVNAPNIDHQFTVMEISFQIKQYLVEHPLGYVLTAPFEVHLSESARPVQPDVLFIRTDHFPGSGASFFDGAPELVVEVLSPSSIRTDQVLKFTVYEQAGVAEYWIADPKTRSVQVYTLSGKEYALLNTFTQEDVLESRVLEGLKIETRTLFTPQAA